MSELKPCPLNTAITELAGVQLIDNTYKEAKEVRRELLDILHNLHDVATQAERERCVEATHEIAHEAHTMGRIYTTGGEKLNPANEFKRVDEMVSRRINAIREG